MRDIGSFIEYEFPDFGKNPFRKIPDSDIIKLNSCRSAICHALRCYDVKKVWIATYQCNEVEDFLVKNGYEVLYYSIDAQFEPIFDGTCNEEDTAIVFSNYFGILGDSHFIPLVERFHNVIIDNAQGLYYHPMEGCYNVYSPRKFVAAPDGAYVVGHNANRFHYETDFSSDTCQFLFMRSEYGCDMHAYSYKKENDVHLQCPEIKTMSPLTEAMLDAVDYDICREKRLENYRYARTLFDAINLFSPEIFCSECVPMGYPLLTDYEIIPEFHNKHIYQPRYWEYLLERFSVENLEYRLTKYLTLICIDQRYGKEEIDYQYHIVKELETQK